MKPPGAWWRLLTMPILAALAAGVGVYAVGAPVLRSVVIACTAGVVTWLLVRALTVQSDPWPPRPDDTREYGRFPHQWEISGFESALQRPEYLGRQVIRSVRQVAVPVLRRRAIDLEAAPDAERARILLGARSFQLLTDPDHGEVSRAELIALLDRVTQLATASGDGLRPVRIDPRLVPRGGRRSLRSLVATRRSGGGTASDRPPQAPQSDPAPQPDPAPHSAPQHSLFHDREDRS